MLSFLLAAALLVPTAASPRARDLGVPFDGTPGPLNAITDVKGVAVGQSTIIRGDGPLQVGKGPVRTGVTAVVPRGRATLDDPVFAGWFALNGAGEMTGTTWVEESGFLEGPVMITNTHSVGAVHQGTIAWRIKQGGPDPTGYFWSNPVVAETWDGELNDINGFHVKEENVFEALDHMQAGPVAEGNVGGGTGMICNGFKGGIGTASRVLPAAAGGYTVGALVQCNYGRKQNLLIAGVPVGPRDRRPRRPRRGQRLDHRGTRHRRAASAAPVEAHGAPCRPRPRPRRRDRLATARATSSSPSRPPIPAPRRRRARSPSRRSRTTAWTRSSRPRCSPSRRRSINAMVAAETMTGAGGHTVRALPHDELQRILKKYNRLVLPVSGR